MKFTIDTLANALRGFARTTPILVRMPNGTVCQVESLELMRLKGERTQAGGYDPGVQAVILMPGEDISQEWKQQGCAVTSP